MTVPEIVAHPVEVIQKLYRQAGCPTAADGDWDVFKHFEQAVVGLGSGEIPLLHQQAAELLPHHSLVRFYGMVQDLLNPEYYVGAFQRPDGQWITTKFCDPDMPELTEESNGSLPVVWERRPVVCVPIPGLSSWTVPAAAQSASAAATAGIAAAEAATATSPAPVAATNGSAADPASPAVQNQAQEQSQPQQQPARAKRERSSDADAQMDAADSERVGGPSSQQQQGQQVPCEQEDSIPDTDLAGDQGAPGMAALATTATGGLAQDAPGSMEEDEATARRVRRREDHEASGVSSTSLAGANAAGAAGANRSDGGRSDDLAGPNTRDAGAGPARDAAAAGAGGAAAASGPAGGAQDENMVAGEVPGSCMVYLYDNAPALVLHEVVEVVGILSHMPQLAALEYDNQDEDPLLTHELASLGLDNGGTREAAAAGQVPQQQAAGERMAFEAMRAAHPPTSKVMRLHALLVRRAPSLVPPAPTAPTTALTHNSGAPNAAEADPASTAPNPVTSTTTPAPSSVPAAPASQPALRERALGLLRWALGGDAVAAEYVLLQLMARVNARGDPATLGQLAMNLCRCPAAASTATTTPTSAGSAFIFSSPVLAADRLGPRGPGPLARALHAALSCLVPLCAALPLTVEACNGVSWGPARDLSRERTAPSPLQLPPGTLLLLDETVMAPGQLGSRGVASMQALMTLARQQELMYDYETFHHPVPVDLPLIVMTEGRSLLRDSLHIRIPLNATQPFPSAEDILTAATAATAAAPTLAAATGGSDVAMAPAGATTVAAGDGSGTGAPPDNASTPAPSAAAADLAAVRVYLAAARQHEGYELGEGVPAVLEQYFVNARRAGAGGTAGAPGGNAAAPGGGAAGGDVMTAEEFHQKLTLARLLVLSYGEKRLTRERWQQLLQLEHTREARLRVGA